MFKDREECVENAKVTLSGRKTRQAAKTNNFGDFEFEGLGEGGNFALKIQYPGYIPQEFSVQTKSDVYLGEILLKREPKSQKKNSKVTSQRLVRSARNDHRKRPSKK